MSRMRRNRKTRKSSSKQLKRARARHNLLNEFIIKETKDGYLLRHIKCGECFAVSVTSISRRFLHTKAAIYDKKAKLWYVKFGGTYLCSLQCSTHHALKQKFN